MAQPPPKVRVLKAPAVRQAELIDCAQALFLSRGYDRTTISDVIQATGLSKGAFYHHFRAKEDLLEAIAARFARESLTFLSALEAEPDLDALQCLNRLLALGRNWKLEHIGDLKRMFDTLLRPENAQLYFRIIDASLQIMTPALGAIIARGQAEGLFADGDPDVAAETLLWMQISGRRHVANALTTAERDLDGAVQQIVTRVRAEEALADRVLGLPAGSVDILGSPETVGGILRGWTQTTSDGH